jgi:hypothetical protein
VIKFLHILLFYGMDHGGIEIEDLVGKGRRKTTTINMMGGV